MCELFSVFQHGDRRLEGTSPTVSVFYAIEMRNEDATAQDGAASGQGKVRHAVAARVYAFDVNETLLDVAALEPVFARVMGNGGLWRDWFAQLLQLGFVATITDHYTDFGRVGAAALEMLAARENVTLRPEDSAELRERMQRLPAHKEVPAALARLRDGGLRLVALTNSTLAVAEAQLNNAGIRPMFEQVCSADSVRRLKPAPEPYRMVAERMGVAMGEITLVAAHAWDIAGAASVGCETAFVARSGLIASPLAPAPDVVGADLAEVAQRLLATRGD